MCVCVWGGKHKQLVTLDTRNSIQAIGNCFGLYRKAVPPPAAWSSSLEPDLPFFLVAMGISTLSSLLLLPSTPPALCQLLLPHSISGQGLQWLRRQANSSYHVIILGSLLSFKIP